MMDLEESDDLIEPSAFKCLSEPWFNPALKRDPVTSKTEATKFQKNASSLIKEGNLKTWCKSSTSYFYYTVLAYRLIPYAIKKRQPVILQYLLDQISIIADLNRPKDLSHKLDVKFMNLKLDTESDEAHISDDWSEEPEDIETLETEDLELEQESMYDDETQDEMYLFLSEKERDNDFSIMALKLAIKRNDPVCVKIMLRFLTNSLKIQIPLEDNIYDLAIEIGNPTILIMLDQYLKMTPFSSYPYESFKDTAIKKMRLT